MSYDYPEWNVNDAKSGLYKVGYMVVYLSKNGTANTYVVTSDYVGGIRTPDVETGWKYLYTVTYDWSPYGEYKVGSVVYFNNIKYVATSRYRGGNLPPNEEEDPDGVRTWMINYDDGKTPKSVFFYRKTFGFKTLDDAYPFTNYLEDISWDTVPKNQEGQISYGYDRFDYLRTKDADGQWKYIWQRSPEQSYINSVMEGHPYHDIYEFGYVDPNDSTKFIFYENAKHKSELIDKLFPYVNLSSNNQQGQIDSLVPKRNMPYYNSYSLEYNVDTSGVSHLNNGVSIEYYPDIESNEFDIICPEYYKIREQYDSRYILSTPSIKAISSITPLYCWANPLLFTYNWATHMLQGSTKMDIFIEPSNVCVDDVDITFHFKIETTNCWTESTPSDYGNGETVYTQEIKCSEPIIYYVDRTFKYNENTRNSSKDFSPMFFGQPKKWIENPNYDPNCIPDYTPPTYGSNCPMQYITTPDTSFPDTSLDFSNYASTTGSCNIKLIGWTIN